MSLKVTLTRRINARRFTFLAKLHVWEERQDIQHVLQAVQDETGYLNNLPIRLQNYMEQEGLVKQSTLTEKGEQVLETGCFPILEQGIYNIWYVQQDSLIGTCPIVMQRIQATDNPNAFMGKLQTLPDELEFNQAMLVIEAMDKALENESSPLINIERLKIQDQQGIPGETRLITLTWHWDDILQNQSETQLEGVVDVPLYYNNRQDNKRAKNNSVNYNSVEFDLSQSYDSELTPVLIALLQQTANMAWQVAYQRAAITLEQLAQYQENSPQIKTGFMLDELTVENFDSEQYGHFASAKIEQLPVMPATPADAKSWTQQLLIEDWKKGYQRENDLLDSQRKWYEHPAIHPYALQSRQADEWIPQLSPQQDAEAFWHIAAPFDLNPS
ncbi:MAG TPA: hypothetical protein EYP59_18975 [Thiotrichaceae bacterium]|nr:hypothetical protein [Thiotrichaceae bacterium]